MHLSVNCQEMSKRSDLLFPNETSSCTLLNMAKKILVADDEGMILNGLVDFLTEEGYVVYKAQNGAEALELYSKEHPDLIILDIVMPEKTGKEVCIEIRKTDPKTPILFLTTKDKPVEKVVGLEIGADDYIAKPFDFDELGARVKASLRRGQLSPRKKHSDEVIKFNDVEVDPITMKGKKGNEEFELTERELRLLQFFVEHEDEILKREEILDIVWGMDYKGTNRTLDTHVLNLRQKIEDDPNNPVHIITSYAKGYLFKSKVRNGPEDRRKKK